MNHLRKYLHLGHMENYHSRIFLIYLVRLLRLLVISLMLMAAMLVSLLGGCSQDGGQNETTAAAGSGTEQAEQNTEAPEAEQAEDDDYIIAILTGTVSQSEESYAAAMRLYLAPMVLGNGLLFHPAAKLTFCLPKNRAVLRRYPILCSA